MHPPPKSAPVTGVTIFSEGTVWPGYSIKTKTSSFQPNNYSLYPSDLEWRWKKDFRLNWLSFSPKFKVGCVPQLFTIQYLFQIKLQPVRVSLICASSPKKNPGRGVLQTLWPFLNGPTQMVTLGQVYAVRITVSVREGIVCLFLMRLIR